VTIGVQDKQSGLTQKMNQQVQTPEDVPRLFDLVTVRDDRLRLAFFSQLGNTVVAKNLDQVQYNFLLMPFPRIKVTNGYILMMYN
jgi:hypothetical protein